MSNQYNQILSPTILMISQTLLDGSFSLTLVGGAVRDFILRKSPQVDFDFEIRFSLVGSVPEVMEQMLELLKKRHPQVEWKLNQTFNIVHGKLGIESFEFGPPRTETYFPGDWGHKNFEVQFYSNLSYEKSFVRRDFTINAIGIEFTKSNIQGRLIDPFQGKKDLEKKVLSPCSENFHKDPVRVLRAFRFKLSLGFNFSEKLITELDQSRLDQVTWFYLKREAFKSQHPLQFFTLVIELDQKNGQKNEILIYLQEILGHFSHEQILESEKLINLKIYNQFERALLIWHCLSQIYFNLNEKKALLLDTSKKEIRFLKKKVNISQPFNSSLKETI